MLGTMTRTLDGALATSALVMFAVMLVLMSWTQAIADSDSTVPGVLTVLVWVAGSAIGSALLRAGHRRWGIAWLVGTGGAVAAFVASVVGLFLGAGA